MKSLWKLFRLEPSERRFLLRTAFVVWAARLGLWVVSINDIASRSGKVDAAGTDGSGKFSQNRKDRLGGNSREPLRARCYMPYASAGWADFTGTAR